MAVITTRPMLVAPDRIPLQIYSFKR